MKNRLIDLNNHLFAEIERLGDEDLQGEKLTSEIERAKAISSVASQIVSNGSLALKAKALSVNAMIEGGANIDLPSMLLTGPDKNEANS